MESSSEIRNFTAVLGRRKYYFLLPFAVGMFITIAVALLLPAKFRSQATILVEAQEVPSNLVRTTVTGYVEERLKQLTQIVISRQNLQEIIESLGLYKNMWETHTREEIVDIMRESISLETIQAEVVNESGRPATATVAFSLSYAGEQPKKVAQVLTLLVNLYQEENLKSREQRASGAYEFISGQLRTLELEISNIEKKIAEFKESHLHSLPELLQLNLKNLERTQDQISAKQQYINSLVDRRIYLEGQLATLEPSMYASGGDRPMSPKEELMELRRQYISMKATHSDKHPDLISLKNRISALEAELGISGAYEERVKELEAKRAELQELESKYSDKHPDVKAARRVVQELEQEVAALKARDTDSAKVDYGIEPDNPAYINIKTQVEATRVEIESEKKLLQELQGKYDEYQKRIEESPRVEQEYKSLLRDYETSQLKYNETLSRLQAAKEAVELEDKQAGEKFTVVEPPEVPERPFKPNRLLILMLGFVLSAGLGVGAGTAAEYLDRSVRSVSTLSELVGIPVLASVPFLETRKDRARRKIQRRYLLAGLALLGVCMLAAVHFLYLPLDQVWDKVMAKLGM